MTRERYAPWQGTVPLLKRAVLWSGTFAGRSRRSEFFLYYIASSLAAGLVNMWLFPVGFASGGGFSQPWGHWILEALVFVPVPALLVRRFRDQGRAGIWALPILALEGVLLAINQLSPPQYDRPTWLTLIGLAAVVTIFVSILLPGSDGENRFGADPRASDAGDV